MPGLARHLALLAAVALALVVRDAPAGAVTVQPVKSPGGVTAWLVEDHSLPIVALSFSFRGGSAADRPEQAGLTELAVGLMDEGAGDLDSAAFSRALADSAATLSFRASLDRIGGSVRTLTSRQDEAFSLLASALAHPRVDPEPFGRIRNELVQAAERRERSPGPLASCVWWRSGFPQDGYGLPPGGWNRTLQAFTAEDVRTMLLRRLTRATLTVGVVGDITPAALGSALDRLFGELPQGTSPPAPSPTSLGDLGALRVAAAAVPQSVISFGAPGLLRSDPDWYAFALDASVLGGDGLTSRLAVALRQQRGLVYSVSLGPVPLLRGGILSGSAATRNEQAAQSVSTIRDVWARFAEEGPTDAELIDAKARLGRGYLLSLDNSRTLAASLVQLQEDNLGPDFIDRRLAEFEKVTLEQARTVAKRMFDPARLRFVVAGKPTGLESATESRCD